MNKRKHIKAIIIVVIIILFIPIPIFYKDGGTVEYRAIVYDITRYHQEDSSLPTFGYRKGWKIELFGLEVYDSFNK